jgi:hypothetical protein
MARLNLDDTIESHDEFWRLIEIVKDRDRALGMLVRFFRLAQHCYGHDQVIPAETLAEKGLEPMVESGWAVPDGAGYTAKGAKKHFGWYRQRVQAGQCRAGSERDSAGRFVQRNEDSHQPLSLALAPSLSLSKKQKGKPSETSVPLANALEPPSGDSPGRRFVAAYVKAFQAKYGNETRPQITGKVAGQIQNLLKSVPLERAIQLVQVYLQMDDRWFETKHPRLHDVC